MVKTAASHAVNMGSNPVRVTTKERARGSGAREKKIDELVLIGMRVHLFPSRTQKLSSSAPTIVAGRLAVKIGNANIKLYQKW